MKPKTLTPDEQSFVEFVKSVIGLRRNPDNIQTALESHGFILLKSGGYKDVYKRRNDDYCVKVYQETWGWREDSYEVPDLLKKHFVYPIYRNKRYLIQPWIKQPYLLCGYKKKVKTLPDEVINSMYDVHSENIRVHGDREVVIDFCYTIPR
jgi:hypothetical protein